MPGQVKPVLGSICHKYGSVRCYAYRRLGIDGLGLIIQALQDGGRIKTVCQTFSGFISPLPHNPIPFINNEGIMCFYGLHRTSANSILMSGSCVFPLHSIRRYSLDGSFECYVSVKKPKRKKYQLVCLENYPTLVQTILNSTKVEKKWEQGDGYLEYDLEGVTFSENDAKIINSFLSHSDDFTRNLGQVLMERYNNKPTTKTGAASTR